MKLSEAYEALDLREGCDLDELTDRWRGLRSEHHPDKGGNADVFIRLREAHDKVLQDITKPRPCTECDGTGKTSKVRGWTTINMPCANCNGSGKLGGSVHEEEA